MGSACSTGGIMPSTSSPQRMSLGGGFVVAGGAMPKEATVDGDGGSTDRRASTTSTCRRTPHPPVAVIGGDAHTQKRSMKLANAATTSSEVSVEDLHLETKSPFRSTRRGIFILSKDGDCAEAPSPDIKALKWSDFKIGEELGSGFYGRIFRLSLKSDPQVCYAVKSVDKASLAVIPPPEEQIMKRLTAFGHHPHILQYHRSFASSRHYYMVTSLCKGGDLFELLQTRGALPESVVKTILRQLVSALQFVHIAGMAHLDIKLENILLKERLEWDEDTRRPLSVPYAQLCDFGISRLCPAGWVDSAGAGTIEFAAPETLRDQVVSQKSDVWSLGVCAFMLLGGYHPFDEFAELDRKAVGQNILENTPVCYDDPTWTKVSAQGVEFVKWMLERDVAKRPTTTELLECKYLEQPTVPAVRPSHLQKGRNRLSVSRPERLLRAGLRELQSCAVSSPDSPAFPVTPREL